MVVIVKEEGVFFLLWPPCPTRGFLVVGKPLGQLPVVTLLPASSLAIFSPHCLSFLCAYLQICLHVWTKAAISPMLSTGEHRALECFVI